MINSATNKVVKDIPVDQRPIGIAYNPANNDVYVVNFVNDTISVIDTSIDSVIDTIPLNIVFPPPYNFVPFSITFDRINGGMYVCGSSSPQVSVINTASNAYVKDSRILPPDSQRGVIAYIPSNNRIYVTAYESNSVFKINPETNDFESSPIPVVTNPISIAYNPRNNNIYIANSGSNTVSIINSTTNSVIDTIPAGITPAVITYNPNNNHIYVSNLYSSTVSIIHP